MAKPSPKLIDALRETARRIDEGADYHWAHAGKCNCGHLAQVVTGLGPKDIFKRASSSKLSHWTEYANDYCPTSCQPMDELISCLIGLGLERRDLHHLEYLSDVRILMAVPGGMRYLQRNQPGDVSLYLRTWAGLLEIEHKQKAPKCPPQQPTPKDKGFYAK